MNDRMINELDHAVKRAIQRHGPLTFDASRILAILMEEVGEVAEALLVQTRVHKADKLVWLQGEIRDVAATAIMWLQNYQILEEIELHAKKAQADLDSARSAMGERGQGSSSSVPEQRETSGLRGADGSGQCGPYSGIQRDRIQDATAADVVDPSNYKTGAGRGHIYPSPDTGKRNTAGE